MCVYCQAELMHSQKTDTLHFPTFDFSYNHPSLSEERDEKQIKPVLPAPPEEYLSALHSKLDLVMNVNISTVNWLISNSFS